MATKDELKELFSKGKKPTESDFALLIDGVKGEKGDRGNDGAKGDTGEKGSDGFGTEEHYNDLVEQLANIVSRLEQLESNVESEED